ncbi:MAG TPA: hypothetical protein VK144_01755 [Bacillota bacterium]|nr:hypothetical protein [Bacillota bacterium]
MIILGFMFLIIGLLVISGTYALYAYATVSTVDPYLFDISITSWVVIPGVLLAIFLVVAIVSIIKMQRGGRWQPFYILSLLIYFVPLALYYKNVPEPLKDFLAFSNLCFIIATICLFIGHAQVKKKLEKEGIKDIN